MPSETPQEITNDDLAELVKAVLGDTGKLYGDLASKLATQARKLEQLAKEQVGQQNTLARIENWIRQADGRLGDIEADLSRLLALAEQAEKFLHNPIGAYKAARLGRLPRDG